jgi:hypothetical protein
MELVREVLLRVEGLDGPPGSRWLCRSFDPEFQIEAWSGDQVDHCLRLLADADFLLNAKPANDGVMLSGVSWKGCEFLDTVRSPELCAFYWDSGSRRGSPISTIAGSIRLAPPPNGRRWSLSSPGGSTKR